MKPSITLILLFSLFSLLSLATAEHTRNDLPMWISSQCVPKHRKAKKLCKKLTKEFHPVHKFVPLAFPRPGKYWPGPYHGEVKRGKTCFRCAEYKD
ncbi:hypothetical protein BCR34DRAFT_608490 [Clohesyomyces aquaticus]|uniref:Uncharacterized protein n=1 Tax=Clohesyomyces aquaticus TaxID=1231657 RepID=A0A1Y1Y6Q4_9PLEO|nr:hypothetical protein BCR34DRAFT_608490 [Clohesyomyces aquaticus]